MKRIAEKISGSRVVAAMAVFLALNIAVALSSCSLLAQGPAPASLHGHVNNAAGVAIPGTIVKLTTDHSNDPKTIKWLYTFPVDPSGDYKGEGIAPNTYTVVVTKNDVIIDFFKDLTFKAGEDKLVTFDMTRKEFIDKMTPEEKQQLEEYKTKTAAALAANSKIANLNAALKQARDDNKAGNYDAAAAAMTQATTQKPDEAILWITLGDAQLGSADKAQKDAKTAGKSTTDPAIVQKYTDAVTSYKKAIDLNAASKKPSPETAADAYNQIGQAYGHSGDAKSASDAYDSAAKAEPAKGGNVLLQRVGSPLQCEQDG